MNYIFYILSVVLLAISILLFINNRKLKKETNAQSNAITGLNSLTTYYKDKYDIEHASRQVVETNLETARELYKKDIEDLSERANTKPKLINEFVKIGTEVSQVLEPKIVYVDSSKNNLYPIYNIEYKDEYLSLNGFIGKDSSKLKYYATDSLGIVFLTRKTGFLKLKKETYIDIFSYNKNVKIKSANAVKIDDKYQPSRFGIGPYVGITYNNGSIKPSIGVSVHYSLLRF